MSLSYPSSIYVIRHCDKDANSGNLCSKNGYKRALLLAGATGGTCSWTDETCNVTCENLDFSEVGYFSPLLGQYPIFLAPVSSEDSQSGKLPCGKCSKANRCCMLLNPLAKRYNTKINPNGEVFCDTQPTEIAHFILDHPELYGGRDIVLAYEHEAIPMLVNSFGINPQLMGWPKVGSDRFDLVFKITFPNGKAILESIESQNLIPKVDSTNILDFHGTTPVFNPTPNANSNCVPVVSTTENYAYQTQKPEKSYKNCGMIYYCVGGFIIFLIIVLLFLYFTKY
jgi:hypothetical protein